MPLVHGTCVSIEGKGVVLLGASGSGKSDLALRLIDGGAILVSDDQIDMVALRKTLIAAPPAEIKGLLEVRGVGIFQMGFVEDVAVALAVQLIPRTSVERMPELEFWDCMGVQVSLLSLHAFDASTPAKIRMVLHSS